MRTVLRLPALTLLAAGVTGVLATGYSQAGEPAVRPYTAQADSSLYQLALQSGITVRELRVLNKGSLDRRDTLKAGESLLLPASSPLFPVKETHGLITSDLPELGQGNDPVPAAGNAPDPVASRAAGTAQMIGAQNWNNMTGDRVKNQAKGWVTGQAKSRVLAPVQQKAQDLLGKFGKAQVSLAVDDDGDFSKSSFSLFSPWYETDDLVVFTQAGVHDQDGRTIGNLGLGVRHDHDNWLVGYNTFIDQDISRNHTRLGLGMEFWADYTRLAGNYYHPLSSWKDSPDFDDYLERPAKGFDIRFQGYLPAYPHLGASLVYEQYFGDEVALFGKDNLQSDPHAITVGVDYTPVPLVTLKASHKEGQQGKKEAQADLQLNYQIGTPLAAQLDPDNVSAMRTLRGSRYDMVDRNYDIVLEYKEKSGLLEVDLAAVPDTLLEGDTYIMQPRVKNKYRITRVTWNGDVVPLSILATSGVLNPQGWQITLPAWGSAPEDANRYQLSVTLEDEKGRTVTSNTVDILVGHQRQARLVLESEGQIPASGLEADRAKLVARVEDHQGQVINDANVTPAWTVTHAASGMAVSVVPEGSSCPLDTQGVPEPCMRAVRMQTEVRDGVPHYVHELVSTLAGEFVVQTGLGDYGITNPQTVTFTLSVGAGAVARSEIQDPAGQDILTTGAHPKVGVTYSVKFFDAAGNDITTTLAPESLHWRLDGANSAGCAVTLSDHDTGVTGYQFTPRTNADSNSGVACGDQGFALKVTY